MQYHGSMFFRALLCFFIFSTFLSFEEKKEPEIENTAEFIAFFNPEFVRRDSIQKDGKFLIFNELDYRVIF